MSAFYKQDRKVWAFIGGKTSCQFKKSIKQGWIEQMKGKRAYCMRPSQKPALLPPYVRVTRFMCEQLLFDL